MHLDPGRRAVFSSLTFTLAFGAMFLLVAVKAYSQGDPILSFGWGFALFLLVVSVVSAIRLRFQVRSHWRRRHSI